MAVGTVAYCSPEQVSAEPVDGRSDIYSLGTVLYQCVTGRTPFTGDVQAVLYRIVRENAQLREHVWRTLMDGAPHPAVQ